MTGIREAVGIFETAESLESAVDELLTSGFDRMDISLLADENTVAGKLGRLYTRAEELEDDGRAPRTAFVSTESIGDAEGGLVGALLYIGAVASAGVVVASGGALAAIIAAAAIGGGTGGLIGSALATLVGKQHADYLQAQIDQGGLLLWVTTPDPGDEHRATEILNRHSGRDVHTHTIGSP